MSPVFGRSASRAGDAPRLPTVAAITMVRDEGKMLPLWLRHYGDQVGVEHLLVVDDNSTDGSTDDLPCPVVRMPPLTKRPFEPARMNVVSGFAAALLEGYDAVLFTDADEFLVADPRRYAGLRELVADRPDAQAIGAVGLNVVHDVGGEDALDLGRPLLDQRRLAVFVPLMCKPSVKRVPAAWAAGSHGLVGTPYDVDPDLYLFHMKFADRDQLREVADHRRVLVDRDGRAAETNWNQGGENMVALLEEITAGAARGRVEEFSPKPRRLAKIVERQPNGVYRSTGLRQVNAMRKNPVVRIPDRFVGAF